MNIHEHQAQEILREYGAPVSNGIVIETKDELKLVVDEAKSILDVEKVIASIILMDDLRIQKINFFYYSQLHQKSMQQQMLNLKFLMLNFLEEQFQLPDPIL